ncbi:MAG: hypothetical protein KKD18_03735 [Nanoarchaeota archaeon]|nr:hypothetical protein [Nanoarchaeota archaeon]
MPEQIERHKLREHILESFVRAIIISSYDERKDKELQERLMKDRLEDMTDELKRTKPPAQIEHPPEYIGGIPLPSMPQPPEVHQFQRRFGLVKPRQHSSPMRMPRIPMHSPVPLPQWQPTKFKSGQKVETVNLGKLAGILIDPSVFSVECPGPYKSLLVNRSGSLQTSGVTLTPEEINAVMHNISDQTRIPLTPGVFRAALQDLVITAVLSDYVGTRFVIQKRNPFMRY